MPVAGQTIEVFKYSLSVRSWLCVFTLSGEGTFANHSGALLVYTGAFSHSEAKEEAGMKSSASYSVATKERVSSSRV